MLGASLRDDEFARRDVEEGDAPWALLTRGEVEGG